MKRSKDSWQDGSNKKGIRELRAAFNSAKSAHEMLKIFPKMEAKLQENQLGLDLRNLASKLLVDKQDPLKVLSFGKRALNIYLKSDEHSVGLDIHGSSLVIASILIVLGSACFELKRYDECLSYLNWAERNTKLVVLDDSFDNECVLTDLHNLHLELSRVKRVMGRGDEVVFHLKRVLEIGEKFREKGCIELGRANGWVSDAYLELKNYKQALPFALKALEIFKKHLSGDSEELTMFLMSLGQIYSGLGEHDKALELTRLGLSGLKIMGNTCHLLRAKLVEGQILGDLGRYEEAIKALKPVISQAETAGIQQAKSLASVLIAKAFCRLEKYDDAKKYIKIAERVLEKKGLDVVTIATGLTNMSMLYQEREEYDMAISLVQKALNIPDLPQVYFADSSFRLFSLVSLSGTEEKRLSLLEEVVKRLEDKFGSKHSHVGNAYANLGVKYMSLGRPDTAAGCFLRAKDILNVSLGPHHSDSLEANQALSVAYAGIKSYDLATEIVKGFNVLGLSEQDKVVEGFKGLGLSEQVSLDGAVQILNMMKGKSIGVVADSHTRAFHQFEDGEDLSDADSECGVSDDEKVASGCRSKTFMVEKSLM